MKRFRQFNLKRPQKYQFIRGPFPEKIVEEKSGVLGGESDFDEKKT